MLPRNVETPSNKGLLPPTSTVSARNHSKPASLLYVLTLNSKRTGMRSVDAGKRTGKIVSTVLYTGNEAQADYHHPPLRINLRTSWTYRVGQMYTQDRTAFRCPSPDCDNTAHAGGTTPEALEQAIDMVCEHSLEECQNKSIYRQFTDAQGFQRGRGSLGLPPTLTLNSTRQSARPSICKWPTVSTHGV